MTRWSSTDVIIRREKRDSPSTTAAISPDAVAKDPSSLSPAQSWLSPLYVTADIQRLPGRHNFWSTWAAVLKRGEFRPRGIAPYYEANVGDSSLFWIIREKRRHSIWASVLSLFLLYRAPCTFNDGAEWSYQTHSHSSHLFFFLQSEMNSALMGNCTSRRKREPTTISIANTARKCAWQCTSKLVYNTY